MLTVRNYDIRVRLSVGDSGHAVACFARMIAASGGSALNILLRSQGFVSVREIKKKERKAVFSGGQPPSLTLGKLIPVEVQPRANLAYLFCDSAALIAIAGRNT